MALPLHQLSQFDFNDKTAQWAIICAALLGVFYVLMRPKAKKRDAPPTLAGPRFSLAQQRQVEQQMQNLLVEFAQMARQMSAQLDTRAAKLELLLKEADQKLAELRASAAAAVAPPPPPAMGAFQPMADEEPPSERSRQATETDPPSPAPDVVDPSAPEDEPPIDPASAEDIPAAQAATEPTPTPIRLNAQARRKGAGEPPARAPGDSRHSEVYALADEGRSPDDIARHLHRPRGEVDLILALRPR